MKKQILFSVFLMFLILSTRAQEASLNKYEDLEELFKAWRSFEKPPLKDGAPDYSAETFEKRWPKFQELQNQLKAIDTANWSTENQVD